MIADSTIGAFTGVEANRVEDSLLEAKIEEGETELNSKKSEKMTRHLQQLKLKEVVRNRRSPGC